MSDPTNPLNSKRFLAFLFGLAVAYVLGTKKLTHTLYIGIIIFLVSCGRYPHIVGWTQPWVMASIFGAMFFFSMGVTVGQELHK